MKHLKNIHDCLVFEDGIAENFREKSLLDDLDSSNEKTETPETLVNCPACPSKFTHVNQRSISAYAKTRDVEI